MLHMDSNSKPVITLVFLFKACCVDLDLDFVVAVVVSSSMMWLLLAFFVSTVVAVAGGATTTHRELEL